eukprot:534885_1
MGCCKSANQSNNTYLQSNLDAKLDGINIISKDKDEEDEYTLEILEYIERQKQVELKLKNEYKIHSKSRMSTTTSLCVKVKFELHQYAWKPCEYIVISSNITAYDIKCKYTNIASWKIDDNNRKSIIILLRYNKLVDPKIAFKLTNLIKPLQNDIHNYQDEKSQDTICQFQYYSEYKKLYCIPIRTVGGYYENTRWHTEGNANDDIIAVGLYYFDLTENSKLYFDENYLEIAEQNVYYTQYSNKDNGTVKVNLKQNDCVAFLNKTEQGNMINHRSVISTKGLLADIEGFASSKILSFFLLAPKTKHWKVDIFIKYLLNHDMNIMNNIYDDLILLIKIFAFGDDKYQKEQICKFRTENTH